MAIYGRRRKSRALVVFLIIILSLVAIGGILAILQFSGKYNFLSVIPGYESVYKAFYGHICCEEGAFEPPYVRYADDRPTYVCDAYTDECRITLIYDDISAVWGLPSTRPTYKVDGVTRTKTWGDTSEIVIPYGSKIEFIESSDLPGKDLRGYYRYSAKHRKFYIQGVENGKVFTSASCILNPDLKKRVLAGGLNELSKTGVNRCQNYITDYILVETKTYDYRGESVICQAREIYNIDVLDLLDGSTRYIQGSRIKSVECCPTEANCDIDFKFKEVVEKECTYDYECPNAGNPVGLTGTSYVKFNCLNGICKQSAPVNVQCTNNAICVALYNKPNMVCKNWRCTEDDVWIGHCGDGKCESIIGETAISCPDDCAEGRICKWYQEYREEIDYPFYKFWLKDKPAGCYTATWLIVAVVVLVLGFLIGGFITVNILIKRLTRRRD